MFQPIIGDEISYGSIKYKIVELNIKCHTKGSFTLCSKCKGRAGLRLSNNSPIKDRCLWDINGNLSMRYNFKETIQLNDDINILNM